MGSFNLTCFASGQTIRAKDSCLLMPIAQQSSFEPVTVKVRNKLSRAYGVSSSNCDPRDFWAPVGGPIAALYADFGRVNLLDTPANHSWLRGFFKNLRLTAAVTLPEGDLRGFDFNAFILQHGIDILDEETDVTPAKAAASCMVQALMCFDYIWDAAQTNQLFVIHPGTGAIRALQFAILHGEAVAELRALASQFQGRPKVNMTPRALFNRAFLSARKEASSRCKKQRFELEYTFGHLLQINLKRLSDELNYVPGAKEVFEEALMAWRSAKKPTQALLFRTLTPYLELAYLLRALQRLNLYWSPLVTCGQDEDNAIGTLYARFIAAASKAVTVALKSRKAV